MLKAFEYRIYPTKEQEVLLTKHFGSVRFIYNHFLRVCIDSYTVTKKKPSKFELMKQLTQLKEFHPWLEEANSQSLQGAISHLDNAYQRFFKAKKGFPSFKSKHDKQSFSIPQAFKASFKEGVITLPKFKEGIKTLFHRKFSGTIKTCTIKKSKTHKYFVSILVEDGTVAPMKPIASIDNAIGIDVGIKSFATCSNGEVIDNPRLLSTSLPKLKRLQRSLSRKKKGSNNSSRAKAKLALLHERVSNQRKDFLHKVSTRLVCENQTLCVETLNIKGLLRNHKLARHIQDLGLSMFFNMLKYKTDWYGKNLLSIGTFEPSSKTCSVCKGVNKELTLADREWICSDCGTEHDRDFNASLNIRDFAFVALRNQREVKPTKHETTKIQRRKNSRKTIQQAEESNDSSDAHDLSRG